MAGYNWMLWDIIKFRCGGGEDSNQTTITNGTSASSDDSNANSGAVYVYKRTGTSWAQEAYIKAANNDA